MITKSPPESVVVSKVLRTAEAAFDISVKQTAKTDKTNLKKILVMCVMKEISI